MVTHGAAGNAVSTWNYDPQRGLLSSKIYADGKGTSYAYTVAGRLSGRKWARSAGGQALESRYGYDGAGDLISTVYNDNTPPVSISYDRLGRKQSEGNTISSTAYGYDPDTLRLVSEAVSGPVNRTLRRDYDALGRAAGISVLNDTGVDHAVTYGYDNAGRLAAVSYGTETPSSSNTFDYRFVPNSARLNDRNSLLPRFRSSRARYRRGAR